MIIATSTLTSRTCRNCAALGPAGAALGVVTLFSDAANLKLQFDIYHRKIMHGDVLTGLKTLMPIIGHVQIAAVPLRHESCTGELDDFRILSALDDLGYTGFVGCEYRQAAGTVAGLGCLDACRKG